MSVQPSQALEVFFSYAHKDEELRNELVKHLSPLQHQGVIAAWHDLKITAGTEWAGAIDAHLQSAHIILLLVSAESGPWQSTNRCWGSSTPIRRRA